MGFREISVARDTLQLPPGLAAGMPLGADVAPSEPAVIGAIRFGTAVLLGVDRAAASLGEDHHRRWRTGCLGARIGSLLTGLAERLVDQPGKGLGVFGAFASGLGGLEGLARGGPGIVGPPDMDHEADQHESAQQELVKPQARSHDDVPFPDGERRLFYRIDFRWNYPLPRGTRPVSAS